MDFEGLARDEEDWAGMKAGATGTIRNFIGRVHLEDGAMGIGVVLVVDDDRLGNYPLCCVQIPFKTQLENRAVAEYLAECWNQGM